MIILGISVFYHDSAAALLRNGEIVARLLPTAEGSFFDEEDQPDHDLVEYSVRMQ